MLDAISVTDRWVCIVSNWSKHQSNSSNVSIAHCCTGSGSVATAVVIGAVVVFEVVCCHNGETKRVLCVPILQPELCRRALLFADVNGGCDCCKEDKFAIAARFERTFLNDANNWAKGVTIKSSPCLKFMVIKL